jgi:hypothetical protein
MYSGQALQKGEESSIRAGEGAVTVANAGGRRETPQPPFEEKGGFYFFIFYVLNFT